MLAILGHSDLGTTLNTYMHAIPKSQRRAVEKVAVVLCPVVPNFDDEKGKVTVNYERPLGLVNRAGLEPATR